MFLSKMPSQPCAPEHSGGKMENQEDERRNGWTTSGNGPGWCFLQPKSLAEADRDEQSYHPYELQFWDEDEEVNAVINSM